MSQGLAPGRAGSPAAAQPPAAPVGQPRIHGQGTPEAEWQAWPPLHHLQAITLHQLLQPGQRAVVLAPHPDDEVLGTGGLLAELALAAQPTLVIGVTDGEASHRGLPCWPATRLAQVRQAEAAASWRQLGLPLGHSLRLGLPDGGVAGQAADLLARLLAVLQPQDVVFVTWRHDGHPDHEAAGRAAAQACVQRGCTLVEVPVWTWHWAGPGDARVPWDRLRRLRLSPPALARKLAAVQAHQSQLQSPGLGRDPVLPEWALARWLRPLEYLFSPCQGAAAIGLQDTVQDGLEDGFQASAQPRHAAPPAGR